MSISEQSILVVGGAGFIGTNLVNELNRVGTPVHVFDNLSVGTTYVNTEDVTVGDVEDFDAIKRCIEEQGTTMIVNLAAQTGVPISVENPMADFRANALGTINVLEAARQTHVESVLMVSSNAAVGAGEQPTTERSFPSPISPYGAHKLYTETISQVYRRCYGLKCTTVRLANVFGPYSTHKSSVVSSWFKRILDGEPIVLYGGGDSTRDFVHVEDVVRILYRLLTADDTESLYSVGTGVETGVAALVELIRSVTGRDFEVVHRPLRPGEIRRNFSDVTKLLKILPDDFRFIPLTAGLSRTWDWFCEEHSVRQ